MKSADVWKGMASACKQRLGTVWFVAILAFFLLLSLRFAGAEWKDKGLDVRLIRAAIILGGAVGVSLVVLPFGFLASRTTNKFGSTQVHCDAAMKWFVRAMATCTLLLFLVGLTQVENFLGPLQSVLDLIMEAIKKLLP